MESCTWKQLAVRGAALGSALTAKEDQLPATGPEDLQKLIDETTKRHRVPGAAVAVLEDDEVVEAATGVLNKRTMVEATPDTVFQIGSVTKVYTATLVMQLVDEGLVELDKPVVSYLPELRFADEWATETVTVRQLLNHTSGVDGDFFEDTGRGDDCLERYVAACSALPQIAAPGELFSYCNVGFIVAGRLIEKLTATTWDQALKDKLVSPLGLRQTVTLPEEALLHRAAVGHVIDPHDPEGELAVAPVWMLPRSNGPAGLITASPRDVMEFARMHIRHGRSVDGQQVLSSDLSVLMQEPQVQLADPYTLGNAWGLGWTVFDWTGGPVIGHDGATMGQGSFLRIAPEEDFAVVLLTNGAAGQQLYREVFGELFATKGIEMPDLASAAGDLQLDLERFCGRYERVNVTTTIALENGHLVASIELQGLLAGMMPPVDKVPLRPIDQTAFLVRLPGRETDTPIVFLDFDDSGRPRYVHSGGRAARLAV